MSRQTLIEDGENRRKDILAFLRSHITEKGWPPTIQEVADAVGLASPNSTRNHLRRLVKDGYLKIEPRRARAIALISPAPDGWTRGKGR